MIEGVKLLGEMVAIKINIPQPYEVPKLDYKGDEIAGETSLEYPIPYCGEIIEIGKGVDVSDLGFEIGDTVGLPSGSYVKLTDPRIVNGEVTEHDKESTGYIMTHYKNVTVVYTNA